MIQCDPSAFAKCPTRHLCGDSAQDACFAEGSEFDKFNQQVFSQPMVNKNRGAEMRRPGTGHAVQDYEKCSTVADLERVLAELNRRGWSLICVTPDLDGSFFVFFRRSACG